MPALNCPYKSVTWWGKLSENVSLYYTFPKGLSIYRSIFSKSLGRYCNQMGLFFALPLYDTSRHLVISWKFPPPTNQRAKPEEPAHHTDQSESAYSRRSAAHCRPASATRRCIRQPDAVPGLGCDSRAARKTQTNHRGQSVTKEQENRSGWNRKCSRLGSAPF